MGRTSSDQLTGSLRVQAWPRYLPEHSIPGEERFVFGYRIRISNEGGNTVMLVSRHWVIIDSEGRRDIVDGLGVVGQQPVLEPGEHFEYDSFCPLECDFGTMEGEYRFLDEHGESVSAVVGRFYLVAREESEELHAPQT